MCRREVVLIQLLERIKSEPRECRRDLKLRFHRSGSNCSHDNMGTDRQSVSMVLLETALTGTTNRSQMGLLAN